VTKSHSPTPEERLARGKERRKNLRRADQGKWKAPKNRPDAVEMVLASCRGRLPNLVPLKLGRMAASPFGFFRGAASLMAADLASASDTGLETQICGDAHVRNLGAYAAPNGRLVFGINDFDETVRGPFEWDLKRLATSLVLAGNERGHRRKECGEAVRLFIRSYCRVIQCLAHSTILDIAKFQVHVDAGPVGAVLRKAERATPLHNLERLTVNSNGRYKFKHDAALLTAVQPNVVREILAALNSYRQTLSPERQQFFSLYTAIDVAFKVVGIGSIGTRDYVILFFGNGDHDPLFLQVKEELPSCYLPYVRRERSFDNEGRRVVEGQRRMQAQSDPFLGWTSFGGSGYLVRQLSDHKACIDDTQLHRSGLMEYARVCGEVFGEGHARSADAIELAGYCGSGSGLDDGIAEFAERYAEQTERDYDSLQKAIKSAKVRAVQG